MSASTLVTRSASSRRSVIYRYVLATLLLLPVVGTPSLSAEWLVLKDGREIETKGPWTVEGRRITFTAMNGTFSAIRTETVDLDKSRVRNEPPAKTEAAEPPPKEPGLVVRQSDVTTARMPERSTGDEVDAPEDGEGRIAVVEWDEAVVQTGSRIEGRLRNDTQSTYLALTVEAKLLDQAGRELSSTRATVEKNWIGSGETLRFRADFEEVIAFHTVRFEVDGQPMGRVTDNSLVNPDPGEQPSTPPTDTEDPPL